MRQWADNLNSAAATVAGAVLGVATLVALVALGWYEYREIIRSDLERAELQARVLEDHATRSFGSVSVLMTLLDSQLNPSSLSQAPEKTDAILTQALAALPSVRSLSVLNTNGYVLASSEPGQAGSQVALAQLGPLPAAGKESIGSYVGGRKLPLLVETGGKPAAVPGLGFIPVLRAHGTAPLYLVALVNPDSFSGYQSLTLNDSARNAYLLSYQGTVLAASGAWSLAPGTQMGAHHVFHAYLPRTEHASYVGNGTEPGRTLVAFRLSRTRPLVVLVEQAHQVSVARWFDTMRWFGTAALVTLAFLAGMTTVVHRSLRARDNALRLLDDARLDLVGREQDLRVLLRSLQELVFRTDARGVLTNVNERWVAMRGEQVGQALNQPLAAAVEPEDRAAIEALFCRQSGAGVRTASARMRSVNGKLHRFDFAVVALTIGDAITGFAGNAIDVTERFGAGHCLDRETAVQAARQRLTGRAWP